MPEKRKTPRPGKPDESEVSAEDRIENAILAASETKPSWKHRCHRILGALGHDFGDPDWELPEDARQKDMLIDSLLGALGTNAPMSSLHWPKDPHEALESYGVVPGFGRMVPMIAEIRKTITGTYEVLVDSHRLEESWHTLASAMETANNVYQRKINAAILERATEAGLSRRPRLSWKDEEAWTPVGLFRVSGEADGNETPDYYWHVLTHDGIHQDPIPHASRALACKAAEQYFARTVAGCFSLGHNPLDFDPLTPNEAAPGL